MPVRLEGTVKRFIGSSTDDKPTDEVPAGSSFLESNTGAIFRFDGRVWAASLQEHEYREYFQAIVGLLEEIRDVLIEGLH